MVVLTVSICALSCVLCVTTEKVCFVYSLLKLEYFPDRVVFLVAHQISALYILKYFYIISSQNTFTFGGWGVRKNPSLFIRIKRRKFDIRVVSKQAR